MTWIRRLNLERPKPRWEDNIRIDLKGTGINTRNWIDLAQHRNWECGIKFPGSIIHRVSCASVTGTLPCVTQGPRMEILILCQEFKLEKKIMAISYLYLRFDGIKSMKQNNKMSPYITHPKYALISRHWTWTALSSALVKKTRKLEVSSGQERRDFVSWSLHHAKLKNRDSSQVHWLTCWGHINNHECKILNIYYIFRKFMLLFSPNTFVF